MHVSSCREMLFPVLRFFELFSHNFSGEEARDNPYEVEIAVPVQGYEPIQFSLTKICRKCSLSLSQSQHNQS